MSATLRLLTVARRPGLVSSSNAIRFSAQWRRFSSVSPAPDNLPLAGIRVLDMTRVLAGVSRGEDRVLMLDSVLTLDWF